MSKETLYFASCRSAGGFAPNIAKAINKRRYNVETIDLKAVDYSDGCLNIILRNPNQVNGKQIYLFQRLIDPFSEKPDHYVSQMILIGLLKGNVTEADVGVLLNTRVGDYLRKYARENGNTMKGKFVEEVIGRAKDCLSDFTGRPEDIDNNPQHHYPLEGLIRRMIHRLGYIPQMEEATVAAECMMQYGAKGVTLVVPYLEGRSDRERYKGETNLSLKWAKDFAAHGIDNIITWRAHSKRQVKSYLDQTIGFCEVYETQKQRKEFANHTAAYLVQKYGPNLIKNKLVVVGPDEGSKDEAIEFATVLERILKKQPKLKEILGTNYKLPTVIMRKDRGGKISEIADMAIAEWINIKEGTYLADKLILFRDDIIDTVGTNERSLRILGILHPQEGIYRKVGGGRTILAVDNPVLSMPGVDILKKIQDTGAIDIMIAPDTIEAPIREDQSIDNMIRYFNIDAAFAREIMKKAKQT